MEGDRSHIEKWGCGNKGSKGRYVVYRKVKHDKTNFSWTPRHSLPSPLFSTSPASPHRRLPPSPPSITPSRITSCRSRYTLYTRHLRDRYFFVTVTATIVIIVTVSHGNSTDCIRAILFDDLCHMYYSFGLLNKYCFHWWKL